MRSAKNVQLKTSSKMKRSDLYGKINIHAFMFLCLLGIWLGGCSSKTSSVVPTTNPNVKVSPAPSRTYSPTIAATSTRLNQSTEQPELIQDSNPTATKTSTKKLTPTPSTPPDFGPTITPFPIPDYLFTPRVISNNNIANLARIKRIGSGEVYDIAWSPKGDLFAVATGVGVYLYDASTFEFIRLIDVDYPVTDMAFSPVGNFLVLARQSNVDIWDVYSGRLRISLEDEIQGGVWKLAYGKNGQVAGVGQQYRGAGEMLPHVKLWDAGDGSLIYAQTESYYQASVVDFSPDGRTLLISGNQGLELRDAQSGALIQEIGQEGVEAVFSQDGSKIFISQSLYDDEAGLLFILDLATGKRLTLQEGSKCHNLYRSGNFGLCYGPTGYIVFDSTVGRVLKIAEYDDYLAYEYYLDGPPTSISPDGNRIAYIDRGLVKIDQVESGKLEHTLDFRSFVSFAVGIVNFDGVEKPVAATGDTKGRIQIWDLNQETLLSTFQVNETIIYGLAFSPDQHTLASAGSDFIIRLWDIPSGQETLTYPTGMEIGITGPLEFSPDGLHLAGWDQRGEYIYELNLLSFELHSLGQDYLFYDYAITLPYAPFDYSPNNHLFTWGYDDDQDWGGQLTLEDLSSQESIILPFDTRENDWDLIEAFALSPDGLQAAVGTGSGRILLWDVVNQDLIMELAGHEWRISDGWFGSYHQIDYSPFGNLIVSIGQDNTTRLWNVKSGNLLSTLPYCCFADFTPDGHYLVVAGDGVIRVFGIR